MLAGCAPNDALSLSPIKSTSLRRAVAGNNLPTGYSTTYSAGTSSLFYDGSLVATLTTNSSTFLTALFVASTGVTYEQTAPTSGQVAVGNSYSPYAGAECTFASVSEVTCSVAGGTGYASTNAEASGDFNLTLYHPIALPTPKTETIARIAATPSPCTDSSQTEERDDIICPDITYDCLLAATFATGATLGFVLAVASAISNPVFGIIEAARLCAAHGFAVGEIANAISQCM